MTQDQAYAALQKFISSCQINGKKFVLIITGKGGMDLGENDRPKGVLKQNVPKWLQAFSAVLSIAPALRKHGGDGALYVILKREN
jgi:DNA-nicking Smr family endonuclease